MSKVFERIGFEDLVRLKEYSEYAVAMPRSYRIGWELSDGTECKEDGTPL